MADEYDDINPEESEKNDDMNHIMGIASMFQWGSGNDDLETQLGVKIRLLGTPPTDMLTAEKSRDPIKHEQLTQSTVCYFLFLPTSKNLSSDELYSLMTSNYYIKFLLASNFVCCEFISPANSDAKIIISPNGAFGILAVYHALKPQDIEMKTLYSEDNIGYRRTSIKLDHILATKADGTFLIPIKGINLTILSKDGQYHPLQEEIGYEPVYKDIVQQHLANIIDTLPSNDSDIPRLYDNAKNETYTELNAIVAWLATSLSMFDYGFEFHYFHDDISNTVSITTMIDSIFSQRLKMASKTDLVISAPTMKAYTEKDTMKVLLNCGTTAAFCAINSLPQMIYIPTKISYRTFENYGSTMYHHYTIDDYVYIRLLHTHTYSEDAKGRIIEGIPYKLFDRCVFFRAGQELQMATFGGTYVNVLGVITINYEEGNFASVIYKLSKILSEVFKGDPHSVIPLVKRGQQVYFLLISSNYKPWIMWRFHKYRVKEIDIINKAKELDHTVTIEKTKE